MFSGSIHWHIRIKIIGKAAQATEPLAQHIEQMQVMKAGRPSIRSCALLSNTKLINTRKKSRPFAIAPCCYSEMIVLGTFFGHQQEMTHL